MSRVFLEVLVARKKSPLMTVLKIWGGLLVVVGFVFMTANLLFLVPLIGGAVLAYYAWMHEKVEYEYSYFERELSVDKIMAQTKRKRVAVYSLDKVEVGAPIGSPKLDGYKNRKVTVKDYSSRSNQKTFIMYYEGQNELILEWDDELLGAMRNAAPNKIYLQ